MAKELNELIFEIRYKPNSKILDYRGTWAEIIAEHMNLPEWQIVENRIDIYDKVSKTHAFVGFRNLGFACVNSSGHNYFYEQTAKFFRHISKQQGFEKEPFLERIGVRSKFCYCYENTFDNLLTNFVTRYYNLTSEAQKIVKAKIVDIGAPLNFEDENGYFNTLCGPMKKNQIREFMTNLNESDLPEISLYYDIDYFKNPSQKMSIDNIVNLIKKFSEISWERYSQIKNLIIGSR